MCAPLPPTPGTGSQYYYHADGEGSVRLLTDANAQIANQYSYDSYGQRLAAVESVPQPFAWKGREWIPGPNLYFNGARFYDPMLGRFTSEDPLGYAGGDSNFYAYAWENPRRWNDPTGLSSEDAAAAGAATAPALQEFTVGLEVACDLLMIASVLPGGEPLGAAADAPCTIVTTVAGGVGSIGNPGVLRKFTGPGTQVHHIVEQRFNYLFGTKTTKWVSVILDKQEHQVITNTWRQRVPYGTTKDKIQTIEQLKDELRIVYAKYPEILKLLGL